MGTPRFYLRLLPLAICAIVLGTMLPIDVRAPLLRIGTFQVADFVQNLVLFAPLGFALAERRAWTILLVAGGLSITAEILQVWQFERFSSLWDLIGNMLGAYLAAVARRRWVRPTGRAGSDIAMNGWWLTVALIALAGLLLLWQWPAQSSAIADWDPSYRLMLGNEATNDRPWRGVIHEFAIVDRALTRSAVRSLKPGPLSLSSLQEHVLYRAPQAATLGGGPPLRLSPEESKRITEGITASGEFSVIAVVQAANLTQDGPARIVSLSAGRVDRNFDLGQVRDRLAFRVRTKVSGNNGEDFRAETNGVLLDGRSSLVVATYDGFVEKIYVDGGGQARSNLAAAGCSVRELCDSALPLAWTGAGAIVATLCLTFGGWTGRRGIAVVCVLAGAGCIAAGKVFNLLPEHAATQDWIVWMAGVGAIVVALSFEPKPKTDAP
jgi:hypothetical protein